MTIDLSVFGTVCLFVGHILTMMILLVSFRVCLNLRVNVVACEQWRSRKVMIMCFELVILWVVCKAVLILAGRRVQLLQMCMLFMMLWNLKW